MQETLNDKTGKRLGKAPLSIRRQCKVITVKASLKGS